MSANLIHSIHFVPDHFSISGTTYKAINYYLINSAVTVNSAPLRHITLTSFLVLAGLRKESLIIIFKRREWNMPLLT